MLPSRLARSLNDRSPSVIASLAPCLTCDHPNLSVRRSPFHSPAVAIPIPAQTLHQGWPDIFNLHHPAFLVTGVPVAVSCEPPIDGVSSTACVQGRSPSALMFTTDNPPRLQRHRKSHSRSQRTDVGFRVAVAS